MDLKHLTEIHVSTMFLEAIHKISLPSEAPVFHLDIQKC